MSLSGGSGRSRHRRSLHLNTVETSSETQKSHKCVHVLISCCIFFALLSACLIAALVFIGKHFYYNNVRFQVGPLANGSAQAHDDSGIATSMIGQRIHMNVTRLPHNVQPLSYNLHMHPMYVQDDFRNFNAWVNITVRVIANTSELMLHSKYHVVDAVQIHRDSDGQRIDVHEFRANVIDETLTIYPGRDLLQDEVLHVVLRYHGELRGNVGFYRSTYTSMNSTRTIATTKFEPTYARQAFPCFDEPNLKANFTLNVIKPNDPDYIVLSNMPIKNETVVENGVLVTFESSVKMSTYLFCFVVCDFKSTDDVIKSKFGDLPYRVFATPAQLHKTKFATNVGKRVMEYYLDYFDIGFPLPKLDMVAIPDYSSGATEHWGVVTFRESTLLIDEETSTSANRQRVAQVVAHELSHSWFGNLVTMDWWNDLWLNEGFARYIEYKGINAVFPEWQTLDQFPTECMHPVLRLDATLAADPIVQTVETPDEITQLFSTITYSKGASVLRMVESTIGEENFRRGVQNYLKKYAFGNAVTQNLLDEFEALVGKEYDLSEFIKTWTYQKGYPIIMAKRTANGFTLQQKRFLTNPDKKDNISTPFNYRWTIPVTYITSEDSTPQLVWFNYTDTNVDIHIDGKIFVKFNPGQTGYYRVNYETKDWRNLSENIKLLKAVDRAHLIEESFRLAEANEIEYDIPLNMSRYLRKELEFIPWSAANVVLQQVVNLMKTSKAHSDLQKYVVSLLAPAMEKYTWNASANEIVPIRRFRTTILGLACFLEEPTCLKYAQNQLKLFLNEGVPIETDLKTIVYKYGMVNATKSDWDKLWKLFQETTDAQMKSTILVGLTSIRDRDILSKLLQLAEDDTYVRSQDYPLCVGLIASNPVGQSIAWTYLKVNWSKLVQRFGNNDRYLHAMIPSVTFQFATLAERAELEEFFAANPEVGAGVNERRKALENIDNNIKWLQRNKKMVEKWIEENKNISISQVGV